MQRLSNFLADEYLRRGHRMRELTDDEILEQANLKGASAHQDTRWNNVGQFLAYRDWQNVVKEVAKSFMEWKPKYAIFNTSKKHNTNIGRLANNQHDMAGI